METGMIRQDRRYEREGNRTMGNVILIGFMGCGKSSIAVKLSYRLKQPVTDMDRWIEKKQGKTISEIFEQEGEEAFRRMETDALRQLKETAKNQVISAGGSAPVREENRVLMKEIGKVIYLRAKPETLYERVKEDKSRPLLQCEDPLERIRTLLSQRREAYEAAADLIVDVDDKNFGQILYEIERGLRYLMRRETPLFGAMKNGRTEGGPRYARLGAENGTERPFLPRKGGYGRLERQQEGQSRVRTEEKPVRLKKLLVINGPNLNFLGIREKGIYGVQTYQDLLDMIARKGISCRAAIEVFQSNHEGAIIDRIQAAYFDGTQGIVINPGAYTHYSYAIRDALASVTMPKVEIHISNIMEREEFRHVSVTAPACDKQIYGHGLNGYLEAIDFILGQGTAERPRLQEETIENQEAAKEMKQEEE